MDTTTPQFKAGNHVLTADLTDDEITARLETLSYVSSPLTGLSGGELGWLARDIKARRVTLPGRTAYRSHELVYDAYRAALARDREAAAILDKDSRRSWWRMHGPMLAIVGLLIALLAALVFWWGDITDAITATSAGPQMQPLIAIIEQSAAPIVLSVGTFSVLFFLWSYMRRS